MSVCVVRRHFGSRGGFSGPRIALAWSPLFLLCMHGALLGLCYGALTWARYRLERSSATLVSLFSIRVLLYAVPSTGRCICKMCSKRCTRGRASAVYWWLAAALRSAIIGIHPGRITTYVNASRRAGRRRDSWYGSPWGRISAHLGPTCGRMSLGFGVSASLGHHVVSIFWRASIFWRGSVFSMKFHLSTRSCCISPVLQRCKRGAALPGKGHPFSWLTCTNAGSEYHVPKFAPKM